ESADGLGAGRLWPLLGVAVSTRVEIPGGGNGVGGADGGALSRHGIIAATHAATAVVYGVRALGAVRAGGGEAEGWS
ncbi:hypothetical protein HK405_000182, partial [Cladochytrium tenue]